MDNNNLGFIRNKLDLMVLILFVMEKFSEPAEFELIADLSMVESAISYFDVCEAFDTLRERGHVSSPPGTPNKFTITEKGRRSLEIMEGGISRPVKAASIKAVRSYQMKAARDATIKISKRELKNGVVIIRLSLGEAEDQVFALEISSGSHENAAIIEKNFRRRAEEVFELIVDLLTDGGSNQDFPNL